MAELADILFTPQMLVMVLVAITVFATVITLALPMLSSNKLDDRMKYVSTERAALRAEQRKRFEKEGKFNSSRNRNAKSKTEGFIQTIVTQFNLEKTLAADDTKEKIRMAGFRGQMPFTVFLFFRFVMPIILMAVSFLYLSLIDDFGLSTLLRLLISLGAGVFGFFGPNIFISNLISRRQTILRRAFPDALDLLLICVEAGMSVEAAFNRVAEEIGSQSVEMAEELSLTTAELSYLQERRQAFENLGKRTGLPGVKAVATGLIQAERYGTPIGNTLRVLAQENRDIRMAEAERKAAGLPPKLTVPMITFFLPVLFVVILGPAIIRVMGVQ